MDQPIPLPVISVFGSSKPLPGSDAYYNAKETGRLLAEAGFAVATGGYSGVMAAVSEGAAGFGGRVIGVTSARIEQARSAKANRWVTDEIKYQSLWERQHHLVTNNIGIIVLPGGIGTLAEFALAWNLIQVGEIAPRPLILMGSFWHDVLDTFISPEYVIGDHLEILHFAAKPAEAVMHLNNCQQVSSGTGGI